MVAQDAGDPPKPIIFDWDDTICPSSFVDRFQIEVFEDLPVRVSTPRSSGECMIFAASSLSLLLLEEEGIAWFR
jgi:hypothetical protein